VPIGSAFERIPGNVGNLAAGSEGFSQASVAVIRHGDFTSLQRYLAELGVAQSDIRDLEAALHADEPESDAKQLGQRTGSWVGKMISKASSGALQVGTTVASNVLTKALSQYLGLPPG